MAATPSMRSGASETSEGLEQVICEAVVATHTCIVMTSPHVSFEEHALVGTSLLAATQTASGIPARSYLL